MSKTFEIDPNFLGNLNRKFLRLEERVQRENLMKMKAATGLVYRLAHARRPMTSVTPKNSKKSIRVSNPTAEFGVPVQTGALQAAINKEVTTKGAFRVIGRVWVSGDIPYAKRIEFGFVGVDKLGREFHQAPRPFMRAALYTNLPEIKKLFGSSTKKNA
jgi:hypothetical protein